MIFSDLNTNARKGYFFTVHTKIFFSTIFLCEEWGEGGPGAFKPLSLERLAKAMAKLMAKVMPEPAAKGVAKTMAKTMAKAMAKAMPKAVAKTVAKTMTKVVAKSWEWQHPLPRPMAKDW